MNELNEYTALQADGEYLSLNEYTALEANVNSIDAVVIVAPTVGQVDFVRTSSIDWNTFRTYTKYRVRLATDSEFVTVVETADVDATEIAGIISASGSYWVKVTPLEVTPQSGSSPDPEPDPSIESVTITGGSTLRQNGTVDLFADVQSTGSIDDSVTWNSSNESIATVQSVGSKSSRVTYVSGAVDATVTITATAVEDNLVSDDQILTIVEETSFLDSKAGDEIALQDFYVAMGGATWNESDGWSSGSINLDTAMFGVVTHQVGGETRVKELNLSGYPTGRIDGRIQDGAPIGNNLSGKTFPPSFPNLRRMTHLRLKGNNIKAGVEWLADFAGADLEWCSLNGSVGYGGQDEIVMSDLTRYNHASKTWSSHNKFNGFLPDDLSGLTNLRLLELMSTVLIGPLPTFLPTSLEGFFLSNSSMRGNIALTQYNNLSNCTHFYISNRDSGNRGEGTVDTVTPNGDLYDITFVNPSTSLPDRTEVGDYWYVDNKCVVQCTAIVGTTFTVELFQGSVPTSGDFFIIAEGADGLRNHYGHLPTNWDGMSEVRWFVAGGNNFEGTIPEWTSWHDLRYFGLGVTGNMDTNYPSWLINDVNKHNSLHTINLGSLAAHSNGIGMKGTIPTTRQNSGGFVVHAVPDNSLEGSVPQWFVQGAVQVNLRDNNFSGTHPSLQSVNNLRWAQCENNGFTGNLPEIDPVHDNFQELRFHNNEFSGSIPNSYGQIQSTGGLPFTNLNLSNNLLSGLVPSGIFGASYSTNISNNKFTPKDIVPRLVDGGNVTYTPQKPFGEASSATVGDILDLSAFAYTDNGYSWTRNGNEIVGETNNTIDTTSHGAGTYRMFINHPSIAYTFESEPITVN